MEKDDKLKKFSFILFKNYNYFLKNFHNYYLQFFGYNTVDKINFIKYKKKFLMIKLFIFKNIFKIKSHGILLQKNNLKKFVQFQKTCYEKNMIFFKFLIDWICITFVFVES